MAITESGRDLWASGLGGGLLGETGTATTVEATKLKNTGATFPTAGIGLKGHIVVVEASPFVYGVILSNNGTELEVDRWNKATEPQGTAAATPSNTAKYMVLLGAAPAMFMALTANAEAPATANTSLAGEITTASGGLIRQITAWAHTNGTNTYTLTKKFTANGSDSLPVTIAKIGIFTTIVAAKGRMMFETLLATTATLSASGDNVEITETVTGT